MATALSYTAHKLYKSEEYLEDKVVYIKNQIGLRSTIRPYDPDGRIESKRINDDHIHAKEMKRSSKNSMRVKKLMRNTRKSKFTLPEDIESFAIEQPKFNASSLDYNIRRKEEKKFIVNQDRQVAKVIKQAAKERISRPPPSPLKEEKEEVAVPTVRTNKDFLLPPQPARSNRQKKRDAKALLGSKSAELRRIEIVDPPAKMKWVPRTVLQSDNSDFTTCSWRSGIDDYTPLDAKEDDMWDEKDTQFLFPEFTMDENKSRTYRQTYTYRVYEEKKDPEEDQYGLPPLFSTDGGLLSTPYYQMLTSMGVRDDSIKLIGKFFSLFYLAYTSTGRYKVSAIVWLLFDHLGFTGVETLSYAFMFGVFSELAHQLRVWMKYSLNVVKLQSEESYMNVLRKVMSSPLVKSLASLFGILLSIKLFDRVDLEGIKWFTGHFNTPTSFMGLLEAIYKLISQSTNFVQNWRTKGFYSAFESYDTGTACATELGYLRAHSEFLYEGYPNADNHRLHVNEFTSRAANALTVTETYMKSLNKNDAEYGRLLYLKIEVAKSLELQRGYRKSKDRMAPLCIVVPGPPGIGKTTFTPFLYWIYSKVINTPYNKGQVFVRDMASEYWEGYDADRHLYVEYVEAANEHQNIAKSSVSNAIKELNAVFDTAPFPCNMAAVDLKGKVWFGCQMGVIITNKENLNMDVSTNNAAAFERRAIYVDIVPKPKYRKPNSHEVDFSTIGDCHPYDIWTFSVRKKICLLDSTTHTRTEVLLQDANYIRFGQFMAGLMREHIDKYTYLRDNVLDPATVMKDCDIFAEENLEAGDGPPILERPYSTPDRNYGRVNLTPWQRCRVWFVTELDSLYTNMIEEIPAFIWKFKYVLPILLFLIMNLIFGQWQITRVLAFICILILVEQTSTGVRDHIVLRTKNVAINTGIAVLGGISCVLGILMMMRTFTSPIKVTTQDDDVDEIEPEKPPSWNMPKRYKPPLFTGAPEVLSNKVLRNCIRIRIVFSPTHVTHTHIMGIKGNYAVINTHVLKSIMPPEVYFLEGNCPAGRIVKADWETSVKIAGDLTLVKFGHKFADLYKHIQPEVNSNEGIILAHGEKVRYKYFPTAIVDGTKWTHVINATLKTPTTVGSCGIPYINCSDGGASICAIHFAGNNAGSIFGMAISQDMMPILSDKQSEELIDLVPLSIDELELLPPVPKSLVNYENLPGVTYLGRTGDRICANQCSDLVERLSYVQCSLGDDFCEDFDYVDTMYYGPPKMRANGASGSAYKSPFNNAARKFSKEKASLDHSRLRKVIERLHVRLSTDIGPQIKKLKPFTLKEAINGIKGDPYVRKINMSTSPGYGLRGVKGDHFDSEWVGEDEIFTPKPKLQQSIDAIILTLLGGKIPNEYYSAKLKDEALPLTKVQDYKTRLFYMQPLALFLVSKMYLGPFYKLLVKYRKTFCSAVGVNMYVDADSLFEYMTEFPNNFEGDYSGFDVHLPFDISWATSTFIYETLERGTYTLESLVMVRGLLVMGLFPLVELLTDIFLIPGLQPSGKGYTAEDNCVKNLFMLMYAWYSIPGLDKYDFFDHTRFVTYGDDVGGSVSDIVKELYNCVSYADIVKRLYHMGFTNSEKGDIDREFIPKSEVTFLKRNFVYHNGKIRAPLSKHSLHRMLQWRIPSKSVSGFVQDKGAFTSFLFEIWLHCDENLYNKWRLKLLDALRTWNIDVVSTDLPLYSRVSDTMNGVEEPPRQVLESFTGFFLEHCDGSQIKQKDRRWESERSRSLLNNRLEENIFSPLSALDGTHLQADEGAQHSGSVNSGNIDVEQVVTDVVGEPVESKMSTNHFTTTMFKNSPNDLSDFLKRPVLLGRDLIELGSPSHLYRYEVYRLLLNDPHIRLKLVNYAYIRARAVVRVVISGSPFHFGNFIATWVPRAQDNPVLNKYISAHAANIHGLDDNFAAYISQFTGGCIVDIRANRPVDIDCPFMMQHHVLRLFNSTNDVIPSGDAFDDSSNLGSLIVKSVGIVNATGTSPTKPQIQVYGWLEDVELGCPTNTFVGVTMQSDERKTGPIEAYSTMMAKYLGYFGKVPYVGDFAIPSQMIFKGIAGVSSLMGWSRPVMIENAGLMKNEPYQNSSLFIGTDTAHRLVGDPKQELVIESSYFGTSEDEMSFSSICSKNSLIRVLTWNTSDAPFLPLTGGIIYNTAGASSVANRTIEGQDLAIIQPSRMALCALAHRQWRGDLEYTFTINANQFQRGKLMFVFEPNVWQTKRQSENVNFNTSYVKIIDIQETQVVRFRVNWAAQYAWLKTPTLDQIRRIMDPTTNYVEGFDYTEWQSTCNGKIMVMPYSDLQSPEATSISVACYVRSHNVEFNFPSQNKIADHDSPRFSARLEADVCVEVSTMDLNVTGASDRDIGMRYFGELPKSFRSLFKRYFTSDFLTGTIDPVGVQGSLYWNLNFIPYSDLNYDTNAYTGRAYNWFTLLRSCYLGFRGSMRKRILLSGKFVTEYTSPVFVQLNPNFTAGFQNNNFGYGSTDDDVLSLNPHTVFVPHTNAGMEVELPFYSDAMYQYAMKPFLVDRPHITFPTSYRISIPWNFGTDPCKFFLSEQTSCGEDFSFYRFLAAPYMTITY